MQIAKYNEPCEEKSSTRIVEAHLLYLRAERREPSGLLIDGVNFRSAQDVQGQNVRN